MASSPRPYCIATEFTLRSTAGFYGVLAGDSKRLHDLKIFTVLARRFWCVQCDSTAFAPRFYGVQALVGKMETMSLSFVRFAFKNIL